MGGGGGEKSIFIFGNVYLKFSFSVNYYEMINKINKKSDLSIR